MKNLMKWWLVHCLHWGVLYGAFVAQAEGAMYVLKFWVWVMAPLSLFLLADKAVADAAKKPREPVRAWLSMLQAWTTLGLLVWFGHIASGLAWGLVMVMVAVHREATRKARAELSATATPYAGHVPPHQMPPPAPGGYQPSHHGSGAVKAPPRAP